MPYSKNKSIYDDISYFADSVTAADKKLKDKEREEIELQRQSLAKQNEERRKAAGSAFVKAQKELLESTPEERPAKRAAYEQAKQELTSSLSEAKTLSDPKAYYKQQTSAKQKPSAQNDMPSKPQNTVPASDTAEQVGSRQAQQNNEADKGTNYGKARDYGAVAGVGMGVMSSLAANKSMQDAKDPSGADTHLENQAQMHEKQAGDLQSAAQRNFQTANRDYRVEAEKNAVAGAATENAQNVANKGAVSAAASALSRNAKSADYNTHMQRSDQQQAEGVKNKNAMYGAKQTAERERASADAARNNWRENEIYNREADDLSRGRGAADDGEDEAPNDNGGGDAQPEPGDTVPQDSIPNMNMDDSSGAPQHVINALLGSSKGQDLREGTADAGTLRLYNWAIGQGVKPITPKSNNPNDWENEFIAANGEAGKRVMQQLRQGRAGDLDASTNYNVNKDGKYSAIPTGEDMVNNMEVPVERHNVMSDANMKDIIRCLSDIRY